MKLFSRRGQLSTAASFAGIGAAAAKPKGEDDGMKKEEKEDKPNAAGAPPSSTAESGEGGEDNGNDNEEGDDEGDEEEGDDEGDEEEGDDEGDEEEMRKDGKKAKKKARAARCREKSRIAAIMSHPKAVAHADFALKMALTTDIGRDRICQMLDALPANAATGTLQSRMASEADRHVSAAGAAVSRQQAIDAGWEAAIAAMDPKKRRANAA